MLRALDRHPQARHYVHRSVRLSERAGARLLGLDLNRLRVSVEDHPDRFALNAVRYREPEFVRVSPPLAHFELEPAGFNELCARMSRGHALPGDSLITIEDARFDLPSGMAAVGNRLLSDSIPLLYFPHAENLIPAVRVLTRRPRPVPDGVLLSLLMWRSYYHWMCEILPRALIGADMVDLDVPLYVGEPMPDFVSESLDLLGLSPRVRRLPSRVFAAQTLRVSTFSRAEWPVPSDIWRVRDGLMTAVGARPEPSRRLLISRADAVERRVLNEKRLAAHMDLDLIHLGGMTLTEQIRLFAEAELIVAPHGAGLTNLIFAPMGCKVVELVAESHISPCYLLIASALHQRYGYVSGNQHGRDINVDIAGVRAVVERLDDAPLDS